MNSLNNTLLKVDNLSTSFQGEKGRVNVVNDVSFSLERGKSLGIIGESGCGKTVTSLSLLRLIPHPVGRIDKGTVLLNGEEISKLPVDEFRKLRGRDMAMIFQEPMTSLNPVLTIGNQLIEVIQLHLALNYPEAREKAVQLLTKVGLSDPESRMSNYPHQLSGGIKQRVMIAIALSCEPRLLIADEPTTALDVTIQAQILKLIKDLQEEKEMSLIMITHDLGVIAQTCDFVLVMYAGQVVEEAPVKTLFDSPSHPYTYGLMRSILSVMETKNKKLYTIPGMVPPLDELPLGCNFQNRCPNKTALCEERSPESQSLDSHHLVACHHPVSADQLAVPAGQELSGQ
ncbi:MAG: ABC transporter ATP-binding protein [Proteobacteria bacterium]|nr:ABC transporter ATP-binding protein [Pseudomonadota bacterium]